MAFVDYKGDETKFSFSPSLDTPLKTSDKSVTITYEGKSVQQDITVTGSSGNGSDIVLIAIAIMLVLAIVITLIIERSA